MSTQSITYEQARAIIEKEVGTNWPMGHFMIDDTASEEDDEIFLFGVGAKEHLVDHDLNFAVVPGGPFAVSKKDGTVTLIDWRALEEGKIHPNLRPVKQ